MFKSLFITCRLFLVFSDFFFIQVGWIKISVANNGKVKKIYIQIIFEIKLNEFISFSFNLLINKIVMYNDFLYVQA